MKLMDKVFYITETQANPKHVGGLFYFSIPEGDKDNFFETIIDRFKQSTKVKFPFNAKVVSVLGFPLKFKSVSDLDMSYHINVVECDDVRDKQEVNPIISGLHESLLDRQYPLWQVTLIKSRHASHFILYFKIHHMYGDGLTLLRLVSSSLSEDPALDYLPVWEMNHQPKRPKTKETKNILIRVLAWLWGTVAGTLDFLLMLVKTFGVVLKTNIYFMPPPFSGKKTVLTGNVKPGRAVATTQIEMQEIKNVARLSRSTVNEVMLTAIDISVHKLLKEYNFSFEKPLIAMMPMSLREISDKSMGNKIAYPLVLLGYGTKDPYIRLRQIVQATKIVKKAAKRVRASAFTYYTLLYQTLALIAETFKLSGIVRPMGNITISNLPGPKNALYLQGAELTAIYPVSTLVPGGGVNITLVSYKDNMNLGFICCDEHVKDLTPLAQYTNEAFELLKQSMIDPDVSIEDLREIDTRKLKSVIE